MIDAGVTAAGFGVGFIVGLTGMGGGALMTPVLVLLFHVAPLAAVSSDIVAAVVMKPVGGGVHLRRGTVNLDLAKWLVMGSVPSAFAGVLLLRRLGDSAAVQDVVRTSLGVALLLVATGLLVRPLLARRRGTTESGDVTVRPLPTVLIGVLGGLVVGMTSVGSGSLMMILLLLLYPRLRLGALVGTDLVQAVPLVAAAALGHLAFGDFHLGLSASIVLGGIPGIYLGAKVSAHSPDRLIRPALVVVLVASGLKLLGANTHAPAAATAPPALAVGSPAAANVPGSA